jgi:hypothetical protein
MADDRADHGGWLGSLTADYGFFSLYPLLVVFVTVATGACGRGR